MDPPVPGPLDAAARLAGCRGRVLLHSARDEGGGGDGGGDGDDLGRWSFAAAEPRATLIARGHSLVRLDAAGRPARRFTADPLDAVQDFLAEHGCRLEPAAAGAADAAPVPRVIGFLGYELARVLSPRPLPGAGTGRDTPDLWLGAYDAVVRWRGNAAEVIGDAPARARLAARLAQPPRPSLPPSFGPLTDDDDGDLHLARIDRLRDHLAAGDVHQVHLARRLAARIAAPGDALAVYAALAEVAPAPYGALLECDGVTVIAGSPERFLGPGGTGAGYADLLRATFPGGSITGAPKQRAIELIDELEPVRRGLYGGALGYFGAGGALELALATRIGVIVGAELRVHVGGGIVAGTDPAAELAETQARAAGWLAALERLARAAHAPPRPPSR